MSDEKHIQEIKTKIIKSPLFESDARKIIEAHKKGRAINLTSEFTKLANKLNINEKLKLTSLQIELLIISLARSMVIALNR